MNCEQRRDLMPMLLVDALEPAEAAALRAHMAGGCTRCASYLAEADAVLNHLPYALDPVTPPAGARARLFERVREVAPAMTMSMAGTTYSTLHNRRSALRLPNWARRMMPATVAACLAFVATVQTMRHVQRGHEAEWNKQLSDVRQVLQATRQNNAKLTGEMEIAKVMYSSSKQANLEGRGASKAFGRAMWDAKRDAWHFRAFNLDPLPKNEAYQLWFKTPFGRIVGTPKTFVPDEHGDAYIVVTLPKDVGPVAEAFVTDEPSVGTYQPTGTVHHLEGKIE